MHGSCTRHFHFLDGNDDLLALSFGGFMKYLAIVTLILVGQNSFAQSEMIPKVKKELTNSFINLNRNWKFNIGDTLRNDGQTIHAGKSWKAQGFENAASGWYTKEVNIPLNWDKRSVKLISNGIDDEFYLYINKKLVAHQGHYPNWSVYQWTTQTEIQSYLKFGSKNTITIHVKNWVGEGGLTNNLFLKSIIPFNDVKSALPRPILEGGEEYLELYWQAWEIAWQRILAGTTENGFSSLYMDEGFNEQIYQWDSTFMTFFAKYGGRVFPVMASLDNFYAKQRADGYIQRVYHETDGREVGVPNKNEPLVNPPLFAWAEWSYYKFSGDKKRLAKVFPILEKYFHWCDKNMRGDGGDRLFYQTELGSGMDNTPRKDSHLGSWVDSSMQMALFARHLEIISQELELDKKSFFQKKYHNIKNKINQYLWHHNHGFYYDRSRHGNLTNVKHIGAFWSFLSGVSDKNQNARLLESLTSPKEFFRPHLFPTLSASHPEYSADGLYWRGGVWAPTNYMVIKGLEKIGHRNFAREAAANHLNNLYKVFLSTSIAENQISDLERDGDYATLWECYSPEKFLPCTRWDGYYYARQDFVGWTGLGPIALLIENILGIQVDGAKRVVEWRPQADLKNGMQNIKIGAGIASFVYYPKKQLIKISSEVKFQLNFHSPKNHDLKHFSIRRGDYSIKL